MSSIFIFVVFGGILMLSFFDIDVKTKLLKDHGENIYEVELIVKGQTNADDKALFLGFGWYQEENGRTWWVQVIGG